MKMKINFLPKYSSSKELGQGLVEYILIIVFVAIVVIVLLKGGGWVYQKFFGNNSNVQQPQPTSLPSVQGEPAIDITELGTNVEIIDTETVPLFNCNNRTEYAVDVQRSRKIEHKVNIEGQIEGGIAQFAIVNLQGRYGFEDGQTEERSYTVHLTASSNSWIEYTIEWRYVWREGSITVKLPDGTEQSYPYRVRSGIEFQIGKIEQKNCNP